MNKKITYHGLGVFPARAFTTESSDPEGAYKSIGINVANGFLARQYELEGRNGEPLTVAAIQGDTAVHAVYVFERVAE